MFPSRLFPAFLPLFVLAACNGQKPAAEGGRNHFGSDADSLFFSLERTPCFGKCAAYTVTINADGSARYVGRSHASRQGTYTGNVDKASMQLLLDRAKAIGFFDFAEKYDGQVTDLPSTIIRVNADGRDRKVFGRYKTPPSFKPFAAYADSVLMPVQWTQVAADE
jgi:hypothetical protein